MKYKIFSHARTASMVFASALTAIVFLSSGTQAATWKGLEPFVSKRADVERVLGRPTADRLAVNGTMEFKATEGKVTVSFVTPKFVASKKLPATLEGTVLQIVLQHERSIDTPESLKLTNNSAFQKQTSGPAQIYSNADEGIAYTFVDSHLKTTRYFYSAAQFESLGAPKSSPGN